jgi:UDP-GlcNAc:undecaprenyl-phosphate/decaprenyl-phosphate GlcNAc-1-phosphate transferase
MFGELIGPKRPISWTFQFWPVLVLSLLCALAATWLVKKISLKFGIVDKPNDTVKTHKEPVAYLGGVAILAGTIAGTLAGIYCLPDHRQLLPVMKWLFGILAGASIACFVGLIDDILDIRPTRKMLGQTIAAFTLIAVGIRPALRYFVDPFGWQIPDWLEIAIGIPIVIFFVLGATNSLNLLDGLDGLCGGVTAIITFGMLLLAVHRSTWGFSEVGDPVRVIICLALFGGVCGFLPFNRHPAKIFMGDAGSMMLGFTVAALMILFAEQVPRWWMASIVIFGLPILDTATAMVRRAKNKRPLFVSDRGHIYDQMMDGGIPLNKTVVICYLLAGLYALTGIVISQIRTRYAVFVYVGVCVVSALLVWKLDFLKMEGLRGVKRKNISDAQSGRCEPRTHC